MHLTLLWLHYVGKHINDEYTLSYLGKTSEQLSQEGKIAVASSVTVFTVASILIFTVGFLCGHFCHKKRKTAAETVPPAGEQTQIPYCDDVVLKQELELKTNVAYGPIR